MISWHWSLNILQLSWKSNPPNLKMLVPWRILNVWTVLKPMLLTPWMMFCTSWRVYNLLRSERQNAEGGLSWKHWRLERELLSRCCRTRLLIGCTWSMIITARSMVELLSLWFLMAKLSDYWTWLWSRTNGVRHYWDSRIKDRLLRPVTKLQNAGVDFWAWTNFSVRGWHRIRYSSSWQGGCNRTLYLLVVRYCKLIELIGYRRYRYPAMGMIPSDS